MNDELVAALAEAQKKFQTIPKGKTANAGTYSYKYADIGDVLASVRPVLAGEGIAIVQATEDTEQGCVLVTRLMKGAGVIEGRMPLPLEGAAPQAVGSLLTFYRRYALCALVGVAAEDDDDGQGASVTHTRRSAPRPASSTPARSSGGAPPASEKAIKFAQRLLSEVVHHSMHADTIQAVVGRVAPPEELTAAEMSKLIDFLQDEKKAGRTSADADDEPGSEPF